MCVYLCVCVCECGSTESRQAWHPVDFDLWISSIWAGEYFWIRWHYFSDSLSLRNMGMLHDPPPARLFTCGVTDATWFAFLTKRQWPLQETTWAKSVRDGEQRPFGVCKLSCYLCLSSGPGSFSVTLNNYTLGPHSCNTEYSKWSVWDKFMWPLQYSHSDFFYFSTKIFYIRKHSLKYTQPTWLCNTCRTFQLKYISL